MNQFSFNFLAVYGYLLFRNITYLTGKTVVLEWVEGLCKSLQSLRFIFEVIL